MANRQLINTIKLHAQILNCKCDSDDPCSGCVAKGDQCLKYAKNFVLEQLGPEADLEKEPDRICDLYNFIMHIHTISHLGPDH